MSGSTTVNGSATHSYDADGNETTVNGQAANYDFENHLVSLANIASCVYDADGNRVSVSNAGTITSYAVDTSLAYASVVEEYSGTTLAARYDYGDDLVRMDRGSGVYYYLYDGLGSTRQLVNTSGSVTDTWGYSAFGELASHTSTQATPTVNPFLFNAQQFDGASGDYYLRARYYDQSNGRFVSQDPFGGRDDDPVSLHRYLYANADPIQMVDPSGRDSMGEVLVNIGVRATFTGLIGASISVARDAIFNPNRSVSSLLTAAANGYVIGYGLGVLTGIPGAAGAVIGGIASGGAVFAGGWGVGTDISQGKLGEAGFDAFTLFAGIAIGGAASDPIGRGEIPAEIAEEMRGLNNNELGARGEELVQRYVRANDGRDAVAVQNSRGNGLDIIY